MLNFLLVGAVMLCLKTPGTLAAITTPENQTRIWIEACFPPPFTTDADQKSSDSITDCNNCSCHKYPTYPTNCQEAMARTRKSGLYTIQAAPFIKMPFLVYCDHKTLGGGWTVVQRRFDGRTDFNRRWTDYKIGFGNLHQEFWLGLDKLHALTTSSPQELLIVLEDFKNTKMYASYDAFAIGDEQEKYALKVLGYYCGTIGDVLCWPQAGRPFSMGNMRTTNAGCRPQCDVERTGGWWFTCCSDSNLNGFYSLEITPGERSPKGIVWQFDVLTYSLKSTTMMIRPKRS